MTIGHGLLTNNFSNQYLALGMMNGLAIVALAIIFDRVTQQYGQRIQKHRGQLKK